MKITLTEEDIQNALIQHISNDWNVDLSQKRIVVTMTAGRGANGHTAVLEIFPVEQVEESTEQENPAPTADDDSANTEEQAIAFE